MSTALRGRDLEMRFLPTSHLLPVISKGVHEILKPSSLSDLFYTYHLHPDILPPALSTYLPLLFFFPKRLV
jgi:hypothetical protein